MLLRGPVGTPSGIKLPESTYTELKLCQVIFQNKTGNTPSRNVLVARALALYTQYITKATPEEIQEEHQSFLEASKYTLKKFRPTGLKYRKKEEEV